MESPIKQTGPKPIPCPYTQGELESLYWQEGQTIRQIGQSAAEKLGRPKPIANRVVSRWFVELDVKWRSPSEKNKRIPHETLATNAAIGRQALAEKRAAGLVVYKTHPKPVETHPCGNPACDKPAVGIYCSHHCAALVSHVVRRFVKQEESKYEAKRGGYQDTPRGKRRRGKRKVVVFACDWCRTVFAQYRSRRQQPHRFCGRRCSGFYSNSLGRTNSALSASSPVAVKAGQVRETHSRKSMRPCAFCKESTHD